MLTDIERAITIDVLNERLTAIKERGRIATGRAGRAASAADFRTFNACIAARDKIVRRA